MKRKPMKIVTLYLPELYIKQLDELVKKNMYANRAEAMRTAIRDLLKSELWDSQHEQT